jgi:fused signal recognition particle receptor
VFGLSVEAGTDAWDALEEALVAADVGPLTAMALVDATRDRLGKAAASADRIRELLAEELVERLHRVEAGPFDLGPAPSVVMLVGVNGTGKTTTIAKLAARFKAEGKSVMFAAADTFRAAAVEQLRLWGEQIGVPVVAQRTGADPAAVAFDAVVAAEARKVDVVIVDTAGRLHTSGQLMAELAKVRRVIGQRLPGQPRHVLLTLDATVGQNGLPQAEVFAREAGVTSIVLTKLDGTAKGGVAIAVAERLQLPISFIGIGEEPSGLAPFDASSYVQWLLAS